jgi:tRNA-specific 2-thiouridylase
VSERIAVLTSGGVDSTLALHLLAERADAEIVAFYLKIWLEDELAFLGSCPWLEDLEIVQQECARLGITLEVVPLQREYHERVVSYALGELAAGRTPSSDILCNSTIKFGAFLDAIGDRFDRVASGHYARTLEDGDVVRLLRGVDPVKDQTYFLCRLRQEQVRRCLFPVGHLTKNEVRRLARERNLVNAGRKDSQGICFLGKIPYNQFVDFHLGENPGAIVEKGTGRVLGEHQGLWFHTIGQRRGLGLGDGPWYVVDKDVADNAVLVAHGRDLAEHRRRSFRVADVNWIANRPGRDRLQVRIRHGAELWDAQVAPGDGGELTVRLDEGDPGVAPGQFAVLYDGEECLGGGPIV